MPTCKSMNSKAPVLLRATVCVTPVATATAVALPLMTAAPLGSVTVPTMSAVVTCACAVASVKKQKHTALNRSGLAFGIRLNRALASINPHPGDRKTLLSDHRVLDVRHAGPLVSFSSHSRMRLDYTPETRISVKRKTD